MLACISLLVFGLVDSAIIQQRSRDVIESDLEVTGNIINDNLWVQIDALQDVSGNCRLSACGGHGNCTLTNTSRICVCDEGYCGRSCSFTNNAPASFVQSLRPTSTTGQVTFAPQQCTSALTTGDTLLLVKGSCQTPTTIMRTLTNPTISDAGYATFNFAVDTPTVLFQPFVMCYKTNGTSTYKAVPNAAGTLPCSASTYACPTTGLCVSNCTTSCTNYTLNYNFNPNQMLCLRNVAPLGVPQYTSTMACRTCGQNYSDLGNFFDGNIANFGHCDYSGDCALWLDMKADYVFYQYLYYVRPGFETRAWLFHIMFFPSSSPPLATDKYAQLAAKATKNLPNYDQMWNTFTSDFSASPAIARYALIYRKSEAYQMLNFCDLQFFGYPYN